MKYLIYIFTLTASIISTKASAQLCGRGVFTLNIYTLNGKIDTFEYEVFPVSKSLLKNYIENKIAIEKVPDRIREDLMSGMWDKGIIFPAAGVKDIIHDKDKELQKKLGMFLSYSALPPKGYAKSSLKLPTVEAVNFPVLIKINAVDKSVYILGNYFGGCDREAKLIWDTNPSLN